MPAEKKHASRRSRWVVNPAMSLALTASMRTRDRGLQSAQVSSREDGQLAETLARLFTQRGEAIDVRGLPPGLVSLLTEAGLIVKASEVPEEVAYHCRVQSERPPLLPQESAPADFNPEQLGLNPSLHFQRSGGLPAEVAVSQAQQAPFARGHQVVWTRHPATGIHWPYWLDRPWAMRLQKLIDGRLPLEKLDAPSLQALLRADLVIDSRKAAADARAWSARLREQRTQVRSQGFAVVRGLIPGSQLASLRTYLRALAREGYLQHGDSQVRNRQVAHNEPLCQFLHHQTWSMLSKVVEPGVKPSYCYLATYSEGARLKRHTDREQCAWNASIVLDTDPEQRGEEAWPIYLEIEGKAVEVRLEMGDAVLYRGTEVPHWRRPLRKHRKVTACFFHYVPESFHGALG